MTDVARQLAPALGHLVDGLLAARAARPGFVRELLAGAAFEMWLSFETRFALADRAGWHQLGLDALETDGRHLWIGNEYGKVDLGLVTYADAGFLTDERWVLAVEFKVVYNNKNFEDQLAAIAADLRPTRSTKAAIGARLAVVSVVRFDNPDNRYQRAADRAMTWDHMADRVGELGRLHHVTPATARLADPPRAELGLVIVEASRAP